MTESKDILVEVPHDQWPELAAFYKEKAPWAPHMFSFVNTVTKWKKSQKYKDAVSLFSPDNSWNEDGTLIAIISIMSFQDIIVFTLDEHCHNLYKGLTKTNLINYTGKRILFFGVHEKHIPTVKKYVQAKNRDIVFDIPCFMYAISPKEAKNFSLECPPEVYIKKLKPAAAKQINDVWPHRFPNSEQYLASYIEINGGYGIFLKETDEMVAWTIKQAFGHVAMLQTEEKHKRKGYGSLVTKALSKEIAKEGHWPFGTVLLDNKKSIAMLENLGFRCIGTCSFILVE